MRLSYQQYEEIKKEVVELFERYDIRSIPISGYELAERMGIRLIPYSSLSACQLSAAYRLSKDGFYLESGDGKEYIYFNDKTDNHRINMTILHEIGHAVLGHYENTDPDIAESEASFFAKYAAAPPPLIHCIKPTCPKNISDAFSLSHQASVYAYDYYKKWLMTYRRNGTYYDYERRLLYLF